MKKEERKKNILKNMSTLVIVFVLICCNLSALAMNTNGTLKQNSSVEAIPDNSWSSQGMSVDNVKLIEEVFDTDDMPPVDDLLGVWELHQTNLEETWEIDETYCYSDPFCATINRGENRTLQDEWLITPTLNFGDYNYSHGDRIYLDFQWYTCFYTSAHKRYLEFNISVSVNGGAWEMVWCFDEINNQFFHDWEWFYSKPIDISKYAGNTSVKIAFQYYSNTTEEARYQEFSIDDIKVYAQVPGNTACDAGGPYSWWWPRQFDYTIPGVRFHGTVTNGSINTRCKWFFGDGTNLTTLNLNPIHVYDSVGNYSITLRVEESNGNFVENHTTLRLYLLPPPNVTLTIQNISLGIKADINYPSNAQYNASLVHWWINITSGLLQREKSVANGTIPNIEIGTSSLIRSPLWFLGLGKIPIHITVQPENTRGIEAQYTGWKFGPFVIITEKKPIL